MAGVKAKYLFNRVLVSYLLLILAYSITACTPKPATLPDESKYREDSSLLVNTSQKLVDESDVAKMQTIAMALQTTRTLACIDFNNECSMFGKFLSLTIETTRKGTLTPAERKLLREKAADIRLAVEEGKRKLQEAWEKRRLQK